MGWSGPSRQLVEEFRVAFATPPRAPELARLQEMTNPTAADSRSQSSQKRCVRPARDRVNEAGRGVAIPNARAEIDGTDREPRDRPWGVPANPNRLPWKQVDAGASPVFAVENGQVKPIRRRVNTR